MHRVTTSLSDAHYFEKKNGRKKIVIRVRDTWCLHLHTYTHTYIHTHIHRVTMSLSDAHYFEEMGVKKYEEIRVLLDSREKKDKLEGMKRLIAMISIGIYTYTHTHIYIYQDVV